MTRRATTEARRRQIVDAALSLLSSTPVHALTTRQIARHLGLSQPALFRHFRSRDQLLLAVVEHARAELGAMAEGLLAHAAPPEQQLRDLVLAVLSHVERRPGLPRLLFSQVSDDGPLRAPLSQLVSMQIELVTVLFAEGQRSGAFRADVPAPVAARQLVALLQGRILQWQVGGRSGPLAAGAETTYDLWLGGARAPQGAAPPAAVEAGPRREGLVLLDVRPVLASGDDPLGGILARLGDLAGGSVLSVVAPFEPRPLIRLLTSRGHGIATRRCGERAWVVDVVVEGKAEIDDLTGLEPPEPLERVLRRAATIATGEVYLARLPRYPRLLVPRLDERNARYELSEQVDGITLLWLGGPS